MEAKLLRDYSVFTRVSRWRSKLFITLSKVTLYSVISPREMNVTAFRIVMFSAAIPRNWKIPVLGRIGRYAKINIWDMTPCIWVSSIVVSEKPATSILTEQNTY